MAANLRVYCWHRYSFNPENNELVTWIDVDEGLTVTEALDQAQEIARDWNRDEYNEEIVVLTCSGFTRIAL